MFGGWWCLGVVVLGGLLITSGDDVDQICHTHQIGASLLGRVGGRTLRQHLWYVETKSTAKGCESKGEGGVMHVCGGGVGTKFPQ